MKSEEIKKAIDGIAAKSHVGKIEAVEELLKGVHERATKEHDRDYLSAYDDDETLTKKFHAMMLEANPFVYFYIKDTKIVSVQTIPGHKARYIVFNNEDKYDGCCAPRNRNLIVDTINGYKGNSMNDDDFVLCYMKYNVI